MKLRRLRTASDPAVVALVAESDTYLEALYPPESNHAESLESLVHRQCAFFVGTIDRETVACGAVKISKDDCDYGEIKRVFVRESHRGQQLATAVMACLERHLLGLGITTARLEAGPKQPAALSFYRSLGYVERGPFGEYKEDPLSVFMEKELHAPKPTLNVHDYFDRIEYDGPIDASLDALTRLHATHLASVPFENLDVQLARPVYTQIDHCFEKIVKRSRGGWCYEQNGLFGWVLQQIGFKVTRVAAGVMRHETGAAADANHLCLLVQPGDTDQRYLADVGFGGNMLRPIPFRDETHRQSPYNIKLRAIDNDYWRFSSNSGGDDFSFDFKSQPADESALAAQCDSLQSRPDSNFVLSLVAQIRLPEEHWSLRGRVLRRLDKDGEHKHIVQTAEELVETLNDQFGLDVPEIADHWTRICERHDELFSPGD